jgi:pre-rRNA-processing protein IPI1
MPFLLTASSGTVELGPFIHLPHDCQELAIACLYYFSNLLPDIIEPLACCCLSKFLFFNYTAISRNCTVIVRPY